MPIAVPESPVTLKTLTPLNKEVRPFFLGDASIWSFPSVSSLTVFKAKESRTVTSLSPVRWASQLIVACQRSAKA